MNIEQIAEVCHEANKVYCQSIGDKSQVHWRDAPDWQKQSAIKGVALHLSELSEGREPKPESSHESWLNEKMADGWQYGSVKDAVKKTHPCCVPFSKLSRDQQRKDYIFVAIVKAFYQTATLSE